jgi:hypothetical protein
MLPFKEGGLLPEMVEVLAMSNVPVVMGWFVAVINTWPVICAKPFVTVKVETDVAVPVDVSVTTTEAGMACEAGSTEGWSVYVPVAKLFK